MRPYIKPIIACAALITVAAPSMAATADTAHRDTRWFGNPYFALSGDLSWMRDTDTANSATGETGRIDYDTGWGVNAALGYLMPAFGDFRFEVEGGYHQFGLDSSVTSITGAHNPNNDLKLFSYMGNLYYDLRSMSHWFSRQSQFVPYIGGGLGGTSVRLPRNSGLGATDDHDNVFAYQLMAGISYVASSMPNTDWSLGYRFFNANDPEFDAGAGKVRLDDLRSNNIELGVRWHF
jgi:hypothetical protein